MMGGRVGRKLPQGLEFKIAQLWGQNLIHNSECAPGAVRIPVSKSATIAVVEPAPDVRRNTRRLATHSAPCCIRKSSRASNADRG
jgi:hypothetical protein